jgi:hypothetical protein
MRQWIRSHLTYANVGVTLLGFVVLTGGTAVALNGSNTVFSDDITDNEVKTADVANDTLSGGGLAANDLRPNSVAQSEIAANGVAGSEIANGSVGTAKLAAVPAVKVTRSNDFSAQGNGLTPLPFDQEIYDTANLHQNVGEDIDRLVAPVAGIYMVTAHVKWEPNTTGQRHLLIQRTFNGGANAEIIGNDGGIPTASDALYLNVATPVKLAQGDYVRVLVYNNSLTNQNVVKSAPSPEMSLTWLSP